MTHGNSRDSIWGLIPFKIVQGNQWHKPICIVNNTLLLTLTAVKKTSFIPIEVVLNSRPEQTNTLYFRPNSCHNIDISTMSSHVSVCLLFKTRQSGLKNDKITKMKFSQSIVSMLPNLKNIFRCCVISCVLIGIQYILCAS